MAHWGMEDVQACFGDTADLNTRQITVGGQRLGLLFLEPLAYLLGSTDTILPYTKAYLSVILLGALVLMLPISAQSFCSFRNSLGRYSQFRILVFRY